MSLKGSRRTQVSQATLASPVPSTLPPITQGAGRFKGTALFSCDWQRIFCWGFYFSADLSSSWRLVRKKGIRLKPSGCISICSFDVLWEWTGGRPGSLIPVAPYQMEPGSGLCTKERGSTPGRAPLQGSRGGKLQSGRWGVGKIHATMEGGV